MKDSTRKNLEDFVEGAEALGEKLNNLPISAKTGTKIGFFLAWNPITAPIATGVTIGAGAVWAAYKIAKKVVEKDK